MKTWLMIFTLVGTIASQDVPVPAPKKQLKPIVITNVTIHIGTGEVLTNASIRFENGKITDIASGSVSLEGADVVDGTGKHVYPGMIALNTPLGLMEIDAVRPTRDLQESGSINPNARAIVGYNTDSRLIPTVRSNGVLMAQIAPQGSLISGLASVVELEGWNYEDAAYRPDNAMYITWPRMTVSRAWWAPPEEEQKKVMATRLKELTDAMDDAYSYYKARKAGKAVDTDLRWESMIPVFDRERTVFIRATHIKQIRAAVNFAEKYNLRIVVVGANDAYLDVDLLRTKNIPVILEDTHGLPGREDEPWDLYYRLPKVLKDAGILFALNVSFGNNGPWNERNLPFQAGNIAGHGLDREAALRSVTLDAARILGISETVGSLEIGKDATLTLCEGDLLDMKSSKVEQAFIRGRKIDLGNKHVDLYNRFKIKYERGE